MAILGRKARQKEAKDAARMRKQAIAAAQEIIDAEAKRYAKPEVGRRVKRGRKRSCTSGYHDGTGVETDRSGTPTRGQQRIAQEAAKLRAKRYDVTITDGGLGLTYRKGKK